MDWSQIIYVSALAGALALSAVQGRFNGYIALAMVANFAATFLLATEPVAVAVADLTCAAFLLVFVPNWTGRIVALLFCAMIPVYVLSDAMQWPLYATYAIVDMIALAQLSTIGGAGGGLRYIYRSLRGRTADRRPNYLSGRRAAPTTSKNLEPHSR